MSGEIQASLGRLIVGGWRKEGGKVKFVDKKKLNLEIDRYSRSIQKSEPKTKNRNGRLKNQKETDTIARYKNRNFKP
jgi:hypothetical protein